MRSELTELENNVYHLLTEFGAIRVDIARSINYKGGKKGYSSTDRRIAVEGLVRKGLATYSKHHDYLILNKMAKPSGMVTEAMFVFVDYMKDSDTKPTYCYKPERPAVLGFHNGNMKFFEVFVPGKEIERFALWAQEQYAATQVKKDERFIRYIFAIRNLDEVKKFPKDKVTYPYAFAHLDYVAEDGISIKKIPKIEYYFAEDFEEKKYE